LFFICDTINHPFINQKRGKSRRSKAGKANAKVGIDAVAAAPENGPGGQGAQPPAVLEHEGENDMEVEAGLEEA